MGIVAGLDSSPDFTRIVVCDTDSGAVLRQGYAQHPVEGPEGGGRPSDVDPQAWLLSLGEAAGGGLLEGVQAIGVSAQQNAVVPLDAQGNTVRPAMVGGDKRTQVAFGRCEPAELGFEHHVHRGGVGLVGIELERALRG